MFSLMKLTSSVSFSLSIRISLRLKIHQAQAKNFCRGLDIRVSNFMKTDMRQTMLFQKVVKPMADIVRRIQMPIIPFENIWILQILSAEQPAIFRFLSLCICKNHLGLRCQRKCAPACTVLCLILFHNGSNLHDRMTDRQRSAFFINAIPLQTKQLASAQPINCRDFYKRQQRVILQRSK